MSSMRPRPFRFLAPLAALALSASLAAAQTPQQIDAALKTAYERHRESKEGKNADYIPALAKVDPKLFGIALV